MTQVRTGRMRHRNFEQWPDRAKKIATRELVQLQIASSAPIRTPPTDTIRQTAVQSTLARAQLAVNCARWKQTQMLLRVDRKRSEHSNDPSHAQSDQVTRSSARADARLDDSASIRLHHPAGNLELLSPR